MTLRVSALAALALAASSPAALALMTSLTPPAPPAADRLRLPRWRSFDGRRPAMVLNPVHGLAGASLSYARSCRLVAAVRRKPIPYPLRSRLSFLRTVFCRR